MIRQAHTYLVGAMSGVTLIAIAIAVFVVLVSAQVFRDWPIAGLGGGGETGAVSQAQPAAGPGAGVAPGPEAGSTGANGAGTTGGPAANAGGGSVLTDTVEVASGGSHGAEPAGSGGKGAGSESSPAQGPGSSERSPGSNPSGGGGGNGAGGGTGSNTTTSTSGQVTETVNNTVTQVDETALGGTLNNTGVAGVTEGVVGPESTVGHVVEETAGAVGGLLPGNH
ncbi:MAG: hypothetical protein U0R26_02580 [Solirubrobacterales bacterium]